MPAPEVSVAQPPCSNCSGMADSNIVFSNGLFNMAANQSGVRGYEGGRINLLGTAPLRRA